MSMQTAENLEGTHARESPELDQSTESTANQVEGKRWNLRKRKSPPRPAEVEESSQEESNMPETSLEEDSPEPPPPVPASNRKRKSAAQKGSSTSTKRKARKSTQSILDATASQQLFDSVMGGKSALQSVASEWVDRYQQDAESAMVELIQLFVLCCGCKAGITMEMFQTEDPSDVIRALTENFAEESGDYPLILYGYKKFKVNFVELIERVVEQCQHSVLYDEYMLDTLIAWLVGFTDSQVRAFRHTCTLACVKLVTALVSVATSVNTELDNTQRQIDAERKRQQNKKGAPGKLEKLVTKKAELQRNITDLEETMRGVFSSVFVHRYRDVRPEIRAVCISELGAWMVNYSATFLADSYLKYIGWTLFDKAGEVRLACVQVLQSLYGSEDLAPHLELFTQRFKKRIVSLHLDKEDSVAVQAIKLCKHLLQRDLLEAEECLEVCELAFLENKAVSHAAGEFAASYLFSDDFMARAKQTKVPRGRKKTTDSQIMLVELVRFFSDVKIHDHATYFVDSLWEHTDVLRDWEAMTSLLLDDRCGIILTDQEEGGLIEIIACAVHRATGTSLPAGRARPRVLSGREKKAQEEARENLSMAFMVALPDLISKFGSDAARATNLANIPQHFDLELYSEHRLQKHLESLMSHLHQLTLKHTDAEVLAECALTFHSLLDSEFSLLSTVEVAFDQLMDELVQNFKQHYSDCQDQSLMEESEDCFGLGVAISRLAAFYKLRDVSRWDFSKELEDLLSAAVSGVCSDKILTNVIVCLKLSVLWALHSIDENTPERAAMRQVRQKLLQLVKPCQELLKFGQGPGQREAYMAACDLLIAFGRQLQQVGQLGPLIYTADNSLQQVLQEYVLDHVMRSCEDEDSEPSSDEEALAQAERLNDRRVQLAGFLKLAMFGAIDMKIAAPVFGQYLTQYHNFGDLIRMALGRCREANPLAWYRMVLSSLQQPFLTLREEGNIDLTSTQWADLKDLARKYALSFGFDRYDAHKVRQPLMGIHRDGITFALEQLEDTVEGGTPVPPPNLDFLQVLSEFTYRLLEVDRTGKKGVAAYLEDQLPDGLWERVERLAEWEPLRSYIRNLTGREQATDTTNQSRIGRGKGKQIGRGKRGQKVPLRADTEGWLTARSAKVARVASPEGSEEGESLPPSA